MTSTVDIFISYKREERALAQDVGRALQEAGYTTVTDLNIKKSEDFGAAIDEMIRQARLVVVLWTPASAASNWVRLEAHEAHAQGKYLGVVLKPLAREDLPLELRRLQYLDLSNRAGRDLSLIARDVADLIGQSTARVDDVEQASDALNEDFHLFQVVDRLGYAEGYQAYLDDYPDGIFAARARRKMIASKATSASDTSEPSQELAQAQATIRDQKQQLEALRNTFWARLRKRSSIIWMVPAVLLLASIGLAVKTVQDRLAEYQLLLDEAESQQGLEVPAGQTQGIVGQVDADYKNRLTYDDLPGVMKCATRPWTSLEIVQGGIEGMTPSMGDLFDADQVRGVILESEEGNLCLPTTLKQLRLRGQDVVDISVLGYLTELSDLTLEGTWIDDILPLTTLSKLQRLGIVSSPVSQLDGLENVKTLRDLDLTGTMVNSLDPIRDLTNIHHLTLPNGDRAGNPTIDVGATRAAVRDLIADYGKSVE